MPPPTPQPPCGTSAEQPGAHRGRRRRAMQRPARAEAATGSTVSGSATSSRSACTGTIRAVRRAGSQRGRHRDHDADDVAGQHGRGCEDQRLAAEVEPDSPEQPPDAPSPAARRARARPWSPTHADARTPRAAPTGVTCLREAPSARSRASSRLRWATRIEKVLTIRNAPTTSETAGEDQQERPQEQIASSRSAGRLVGGVVAGDGLGAVGEPSADRVAQLGLGDAVLRGHPDVGEGVRALEEQVLRRRGVEDRERRAVERAAVGEPERCRRASGSAGPGRGR